MTQIQDTLTSSFAEVLRGILTLVVGIGLIFYISPKLTGIMLSVVPVLVAIGLIFGKYIRKSSRLAQDRLADSAIVVQESLQGIATVKAFTGEGYEAQRRFASSASHELRTPLATQRALIEVSLSEALTPDQLELLSRQLLATNERNERLIDGLLALAETDQGLMVTGSQSLDRITGDVVETLRPGAKERGVDLHLDAAPVLVAGELPLLDRLVGNLVSNAIKYNVDGGSVHVSVGADAVLRVVNTGPDVPAELVAGLFEPFRRMSGERLDHGGGVGLGLTIARSIVAAHGGEIRAWANASGGGLTIEVQLVPAR